MKTENRLVVVMMLQEKKGIYSDLFKDDISDWHGKKSMQESKWWFSIESEDAWTQSNIYNEEVFLQKTPS